MAIHVREKSQTSTNVAILDRTTGQVRTLTTEKTPEFNWTIVRWTPDGTAIIANRGDIAFTQSSVWQIDVATGRAEELTPSKGALIYASDISADGKTLAITSNEGTGQLRAGMFDLRYPSVSLADDHAVGTVLRHDVARWQDHGCGHRNRWT